MKEILKPWQGWLLFGFAMAIVFALGVVISFLTERRPEVVNAVYRRDNRDRSTQFSVLR